MSGAVGTAIATGIASAAAGAVISSAFAPDTGKKVDPQTPQKPPQASQAPDANGIRASQSGTGQSGGEAGVAQTFLTGAGGVDPSTLLLGKNTLLGG